MHEVQFKLTAFRIVSHLSFYMQLNHSKEQSPQEVNNSSGVNLQILWNMMIYYCAQNSLTHMNPVHALLPIFC